MRWGQPSYLTTQSKSGSTVRIAPLGGGEADAATEYAMYFICHTNLVDTFRAMFGSGFRYEKNRALIFAVGDEIPVDELRECITMALTYHLAKRS